MSVKKTKLSVLVGYLLLISINAYSQTNVDSLISLLEVYLRNNNDVTTTMSEYLMDIGEMDGIDLNARVRKSQPDARIVIPILEELLYRANKSHVDQLRDIYFEQVNAFIKDWGDLYTHPRYNHQIEHIEWQYSILNGFEHLIKALKFSTLENNTELILKEYLSEFEIAYKIFFNHKEACELYENIIFVSSAYKNLNKCKLWGGMSKFIYIDRYLSDLHRHLIELLVNCTLANCPYSDDGGCASFIAEHEDWFNSIDSPTISDYYIVNFNKLKKCHRHTMAFRYAGQHEFEALTRFLILRYIEDYDPKDYYGYMTDLARSDFNLKIILEEVIKLHKRDPKLAKIISKKLPYDRTLILLDKQRNSIGARELIKHLDGFRH